MLKIHPIEFLENRDDAGQLLSNPSISGVCLKDQHGTVTYSYGDLEENQDYTDVKNIFKATIESQIQHVCNKGINLKVGNSMQSYKIHHKTFKSVYAHSEDSGGGLVLCSFSLGVLICSYRDPTAAQGVVCHVEKFCDILRA